MSTFRLTRRKRGRSERLNRTFQDRLVNELCIAKVRTVAAANTYLRDRFLPDYNATFSGTPADAASAFMPVGRVDLEQILCHQEERVVARDNTVAFEGRTFQLARQPGRRSCAGLGATIRRHLNGEYSIWCARRQLGRYPAVRERPPDRRVAVQPLDAGAPTPRTRPPPLGKRTERYARSGELHGRAHGAVEEWIVLNFLPTRYGGAR